MGMAIYQQSMDNRNSKLTKASIDDDGDAHDN
jgi:hypothetical protein